MSRDPEGQSEETQKRQPPKTRSVIVRIFRAFKRYENRRRRRRNSQHQINERMMARWTRHVGLFTCALVVVGIVTAIIFWRQLNVMQGQLEEMRTDSGIRRSELAAVMSHAVDRQPNPSYWTITSLWTNTGKTNAKEFKGWQDFKIFRTEEDYKFLRDHANILNGPPTGSKIIASGTIMIPNHPIAYESWRIPEQDAWDILYGKTLALLWGYVEYRDIFDELYTIRYCDFFTFSLVGQGLVIDLPHAFATECTERTQQDRKERNRK